MRFALLSVAALLLAGCGYVGDPLPPSLNIPQGVLDLAAIQRGADLVITFTAPSQTTENLVLEKFGGIDLRVANQPISSAMLPEPGKAVTIRTPASPWIGQDVNVVVRLAGPKGRYSGYTPSLVVPIGAPLSPPLANAAPHPQGVRLSWKSVGGEQYRVTRDETLLGTTGAGEFIDSAAVFGKEYKYTVQAFVGKRESETSETLKIAPRDEFAPAAPTGLTAVAGLKSIELTWERNPEPDLGSYRIYRATSGDFAVLVDGVDAIAFSDRQTESGSKYRFRITAIDKSGNESEPSRVLEIQAP